MDMKGRTMPCGLGYKWCTTLNLGDVSIMEAT